MLRTFTLALTTIACFLATPSHCAAGEIRLLFDAAITAVDGDPASIGFPFTLEAGDVLPGEIAFDSEQALIDILSGTIAAGAPGRISLEHEGVQLLYGINSGGANNAFGSLGGSPSPIRSSISLGSFPLTDAFPGWNGSIAGIPTNADLLLASPQEGLITVPDDLTNFDAWNSLDGQRLLALEFGIAPITPGTVRVEATIGQLVLVPEPSAASLLLLAVATLAATGGGWR